MLAFRKMSANQFLKHLVGAGRAVCCALSPRYVAQCWCTRRYHWCPDATVLLLSLLFWNKSLTGPARKQPFLHEEFGEIWLVGWLVWFSLLSISAKASPWLIFHFQSSHLVSISSRNSPVQMDQYHSFVCTLKITHWITMTIRWLSQLDIAV